VKVGALCGLGACPGRGRSQFFDEMQENTDGVARVLGSVSGSSQG
jgi:hypothetical protein